MELNPVLAEIYSSQRVRLPTGEERPFDENGMPRGEGELIYNLVKSEGAKRTLEVGFAFGLSSLFLCQALSEQGGGHHVVIDPHQRSWFRGGGLHHLEQAGWADMIDFHEESSHRVLPRLEAAGEKFDLALVDGSHLFDFTLLEFFYIDLMLRDGGLILFDDAFLFPGVAKAVRFALTNRNYVEESERAPWPARRRIKRRLRRVAAAGRAVAGAARFPFASDSEEAVGAELPWPRRNNLAVLRKKGGDDREWTDYRPF